ncbi:MAG: translation initiation factor IF-2 [Cyclobacteriaceae bacterium]|nr:translation initiation factor IF-2 [Cyclobacteriaceae bacterium]MCX7636415.1 translation initiation factor IF-2 [Cyclobacteriaceae bacterium]MDW8330858.1 translation initiation factor IF-2 [Cyclobacteriaceae bacterium]
MAEDKMIRLSMAARKLNVGVHTVVEFLAKKGFTIEENPNTKLTPEQFALLSKEFAASASEKQEASGLTIGIKHAENITIETEKEAARKRKEEEEQILIKNLVSKDLKPKDEVKPQKVEREAPKLEGPKVIGKIELEEKKKPEPPPAPQPPPVEEKAEPVKTVEVQEKKVIKAQAEQLRGLKVVDRIELPQEKKEKETEERKGKRPRKRIAPGEGAKTISKTQTQRTGREEPSDREIQEQIKKTLADLTSGSRKPSRAKYRKEKRQSASEALEEQTRQEQEASKTLRVTEFISANDLAALMNVSVNDVISTCLNLGMFVSINQRLDAEAITIIADEFGYDVQFITAEEETEAIKEEPDREEDLQPRPPIVTIMGHVDHGKTSLLDYIRQTKVTALEAGGITQHIGAYSVTTKNGQKIAFLDTPGHEAFTAMRARGARITDIAIIVVAADDDVMPQTKEAINHAQIAGVPIVIAINKIDKPTANPDKIRESLAKINILVEEWGGKYQSQEISAKTGKGVDELLEKVLIEAELLNLRANPNKPASGTVIEASLDKGRGYVATVMVQNGTLRIGDVMLAGAHYGRVKAMFDSTGARVKEAGPSTPVQVLGLDGAPQAGERFQIMESDREARELATKRSQLLREQSLRTRKHITLDEIGRRLAIGNFKQLNIIVKGDVDGSVEALSDALLKLSTKEIQVAIIHRGVGQISESDVLLASASDAIIVGFQVRPSASARKLAESEQIEIRLYSIIYDAINDVKAAMEGMLAPEHEEVIVGNAEVRNIFKISKVGTVAGCMVTDGYVKRTNPIRLIRDGIVVYSGKLASLKRMKDDVGEVKAGYECGMSIENFNDIKEGDVIESYELREVKRTL